MAYVDLGEHWENMKTVVRSFGYAVMARHPRLLCLAPGDDTIFVIKKLKREGYWELNRVDRFMWDKYGALGYPMRPWIDANELIRFLYDYATGQAGIQEGIMLDPEHAFTQPHYEPQEKRINRRVREQFLEADRKWAESNTNMQAKNKQLIDERKAELREALKNAKSEQVKARRKMNVMMEIETPSAGTRRRSIAK